MRPLASQMELLVSYEGIAIDAYTAYGSVRLFGETSSVSLAYEHLAYAGTPLRLNMFRLSRCRAETQLS